ncbi:restriction endonuclease subunit S [Streptococcus anginosus]|uniref:restriction endonuclease subunit S n=1 Tax=Streptococcus anginosus TaxID=1328 RepID=UPI001C8C04A9|nr:restriction endonuclease subunit S [Streptococcus anginosus]
MKLSDWKKVKLSELGTIVGGGTPSTKKEEYYGGNIPWITPKDLANFGERYIEHGNRNITLAGLENSSAKILPAGSILFSSRAPIGYIAITANNVTTNQGFKSIIPNSDVDSLFLYYLLKFNKDKIENMGSGTTFKEVSANVMKSIEVFIPTEIAEQRKISAILGAIDDKIENNKKINHHLEQIGQELFEEIYYDGSSAQLGDIISTLESGSRPKGGAETDGIPSIGAENIERFGQYDYTKEKFISLEYFQKLKRGIVHSGDVLLYKDGAYTGKVSMALDDFPHAQCAINEHIFILRPNELAPSSFFLYFLLLHDKNKQALFSRASSKAAQPGLNQTEVKTLPILLPKTEMITKFESTIAPVMHQIAKNANENRKLITLQKALLPKLLSGETSVN